MKPTLKPTLPYNPGDFDASNIRKFLIRVAEDTGKNNFKKEEVFRIPEEYLPLLREHGRKVRQMPVDDLAFQRVVDQIKKLAAEDKTKVHTQLYAWTHTLFQYNIEALVAAPNLCEFLLSGIKHADVLAGKPVQELEDRLADAEKYVEMREALGVMTGWLTQPQFEGAAGDMPIPAEDGDAFVELKVEYERTKGDWKCLFGQPFTEAWNDAFSSANMAVHCLVSEAEWDSYYARLDVLRERDDEVDLLVDPIMEVLRANELAQQKKLQALEAERRREQRKADNQAKREARAAREAEVLALQAAKAEEERAARTRQPPLHPDLADAIEMVNIVDASDRLAALRDLRETALAVTLENPKDRNAEHWASWAKEQMKLARQPDTEWSVLDGQFRSMSRPEPPSAGRGN